MAEGDELTTELLPGVVTGGERPASQPLPAMDIDSLTREVVSQGLSTAGDDATNLHGIVVDRVERELIAQVLLACGGVQTKAATKLGINRNTLHKKIKDYGLDSEDTGESA
jgi:DNA-binding protein Fis